MQDIYFYLFYLANYGVLFEIIEMQYHYYANTTTSLELISGKQIDRYDGSQFKKETTDQRLLRKMNKKNRFRLRDLRHGYRQIFP